MAPLPERVVPMKATSGDLPPDGDGGWAYEVKWDGMRVLAYVEGGRARLQSSNLLDVTARFPDLAGLAGATGGRPALLDGEVVATDEAGRPSFQRLQQRMHVDDPVEARRRAASVPVCFLVFDVLHLDGEDLTRRPYLDRRARLADALDPAPAGCWSVPAHSLTDGRALLAATAAQGLEGLVAKRVTSPYVPGRRSPDWRKVKHRRRQELVVGGWHPGTGNRSSTLGSLLLGYQDPVAGVLRFAGKVGTGFSGAELDRLLGLLTPLRRPTSPFEPPPPAPIRRTAVYVEPRYVAEVEFAEWSDDGMLRHPSYLGLRADKSPADVVREP